MGNHLPGGSPHGERMAEDASSALSDKRAAVESAWDTLDSNVDLDAGGDVQTESEATGVDKGNPPEVETAPTGDDARESPSSEVHPPSDQPKTGETYKAWLARYQGDPEKGAAHSLETQTQNAQFHRENAELKARLAQLEKVPESPEPKPQEQPLPERVQQLDQQMAAIAGRFKYGETRLAEQQEQARKVFETINELAEELRDPGPSSDVAELTWKKQREERKLERLKAEYAQTSAQNDSLWTQYHQLKPLREQAADVHQMQLRLAQAAEAETQKLQAREMESTRKEFSSVAEAVAKDPKVGMPARLIQKFLGTKEKNYRDGYAIKEALAFLVPDPVTGEIPDIPDFKAFISERAAEFIALSKEAHSAISEDYARKKTADADQPGPKGKNATAPDTKRKASLQDLEEETDRRWADVQI